MQYMILEEMHVKKFFILADRLGPEILAIMLEIKGQVLHCVRLHLKLGSWLVVRQVALLTGKLPIFFVTFE